MDTLTPAQAMALSNIVRPFLLLILAVVVLYPARVACQRYMRDGWLKRLLLRRIN